MGVIGFDDQRLPEWAREAGNRQRVLSWVEEKYPDPPGLRCPGCGKDEWTIGDLQRATLAASNAFRLLVPLMCRHCACVLTLDAETIGLSL